MLAPVSIASTVPACGFGRALTSYRRFTAPTPLYHVWIKCTSRSGADLISASRHELLAALVTSVSPRSSGETVI